MQQHGRPRDCHTEWSKLAPERQISHDIVESKKRGGTNELIYETEVDSWM